MQPQRRIYTFHGKECPRFKDRRDEHGFTVEVTIHTLFLYLHPPENEPVVQYIMFRKRVLQKAVLHKLLPLTSCNISRLFAFLFGLFHFFVCPVT